MYLGYESASDHIFEVEWFRNGLQEVVALLCSNLDSTLLNSVVQTRQEGCGLKHDPLHYPVSVTFFLFLSNFIAGKKLLEGPTVIMVDLV